MLFRSVSSIVASKLASLDSIQPADSLASASASHDSSMVVTRDAVS